jgi:hypothetical protein
LEEKGSGKVLSKSDICWLREEITEYHRGYLMISDTRLIFGDLTDSLRELNENRNSPVKIRRAFGRFITYSQQLTETMRREFSNAGGKWEPKNISGWNENTDLFKKLRNIDYHGFPAIIHVRESQHYLAAVLENEEGEEFKSYLITQVEWGLGDPFSEQIPGDMTLLIYDEDMNPIDDAKPEFIEYEFILYPRTEEISGVIEKAGTDDIHLLSERCYAVLEKYYDFFQIEIKSVALLKKQDR